MLHFRILKTKGDSRAVQVYRYQDGQRVIVKHIGSGRDDQQLENLVEVARHYIADFTRQTHLFEDHKPKDEDHAIGQFDV
jgi:hypothetical protein